MGEFVNKRAMNIVAWFTVAVVITLTLIMAGFSFARMV
jgi:Mn2+/Fe2+ NRAMP family transporter